MRYEPLYSKMSTENIHGTPPISRENDRVETGFNNQPQTRLGSRDPQNEDRSQCTGLSQADGSGDISDQAAAETLVHFHDQIQHRQNRNGISITDGAVRRQEQSMPYNSTGFWQTRPGNNNNINPQEMAQHIQVSNGPLQNDNVNTDLNLQSAIFGMSRSLSIMQQKQELFECALQNMVTVLQEMRTVALTTNSQKDGSSISAQSIVSNEEPQNPQRQVVSDGSNTRQLCQRKSSISYVQENESATLMPRANSSRNLTQDSGQSTTTSNLYPSYEAERYDPSLADRTIGETIHRQSTTEQDARNNTYNFRAQSSESYSQHQRTNGPVNAHLSLLHIPINMFEYYGI